MSMFPEEATIFLVPFVILYVILMLWAVAKYVITGISLFGIGKRLGIKAYGLAWVPGANVWSVGAIADKSDERNGKDHKFRWVLIGLMIAFVICLVIFIVVYTFSLIDIITTARLSYAEPEVSAFVNLFWSIFAVMFPVALASTALTAVEYISIYKLIELCKPEKALKNLLIGMLVPFASPFVLLSCKRSLENMMEPETNAPELPDMDA